MFLVLSTKLFYLTNKQSYQNRRKFTRKSEVSPSDGKFEENE